MVTIHTVTDENGLEETDWNAVADGLDEKGFGKLAKAARSRGKGIVDLDHTKTAEAQADAEVEEKASFFSTDATDFKEDGGSRVRFRARRVREIIAERSGKEAVGPYVGEAPPPEFPDAKRAEDGFWYVKRGEGKFARVQNSGKVATYRRRPPTAR